MKAFLVHTHCNTHFWKCMVLAIVTAISYSVLYQFVMPVIYQIENGLIFYGVISIMILFVSCIVLGFVVYLANIKQECSEFHYKKMLIPCIAVMLILVICMLGLGILSFQMAIHQEQQLFAYVINALLLLACMFYVPVIVFSYLEIRMGKKNPLLIIKCAFEKMMHHYQSVFYSTLIIAFLVIGYRYMMDSVFSISMGVTLYDLPLELLSRWVPFLDLPSLLTSALDNASLWSVVIVSFVSQFVLCAAYILYVFYMICIHDEDISV